MKRKFYLLIVLAAMVGGATTAYLTSKVILNNSNSTIATTTVRDNNHHFASLPSSPQGTVDLTHAAEKTVMAVVNIEKREKVNQQRSGSHSMDEFFQYFGMPRGYGQQQQQPRSQERRSGGSGVIISPDGYIISNNHVVENASELRVTLNDGRTFDAQIIGTDPTTDLALIKVDGENLPVVEFGNSDALKLGEWVLAVGNPYNLSSTVTAGIVSAKGRSLNAIDSQFPIESFIQTDAAINPGNSGGALVNTSGELIGINTLIYSQTGNYVGYGFAVPTTIVQKVVMDLMEYGIVQRAMLGVTYQEITDAFIEHQGKEKGISESGGLYVVDVTENGAANAAGIKSGDILVEIDGNKITGSAVLQETIAKHRPNDKIKIGVKRDGQVKHFDVTLRNRAGEEKLLSKGSQDVAAQLGGKLVAASESLLEKLNLRYGVQVAEVGSGTLRKANIKSGFVITSINEMPITSVNDVYKIKGEISVIEGIYPDGRRFTYSLVSND